MAKLRETDVEAVDLAEYLSGYSDFSFELQTLKLLRDSGIQCEHGGLYQDPLTKKTREFDIRAYVLHGRHSVRLSIECKNIRANYPVLVSRVPRHESESFHDIAYFDHFPSREYIEIPAFSDKVKVLRLSASDSLFKPDEPVGKSIVQVGQSSDKNNGIVASDAELFDRWSQCLASAAELVDRTFLEESEREDQPRVATVLPLLIVPNGRLWAADYDSSGNKVGAPRQVDQIAMFVNMPYKMGDFAATELAISHLEIFTSGGLQKFVKQILATEAAMQNIFPNAAVYTAMRANGIE